MNPTLHEPNLNSPNPIKYKINMKTTTTNNSNNQADTIILSAKRDGRGLSAAIKP
jgi:hypothetical protein